MLRKIADLPRFTLTGINPISIINFIDVNAKKMAGVPFPGWTKSALLPDFLNTIR